VRRETDEIHGWALHLDAIGNADTVESRVRLAWLCSLSELCADAIAQTRSRGRVERDRIVPALVSAVTGGRVAIGRIMPACDNYMGASES